MPELGCTCSPRVVGHVSPTSHSSVATSLRWGGLSADTGAVPLCVRYLAFLGGEVASL